MRIEVLPLSSLCEEVVVGHVGPSSSHRQADGVPFLMGKNVAEGFLKLDDLERVTPEFHRAQKKSRLSPGDVVVVRIGKSGQAAKIPESLVEANCAGLVVIKRPEKVIADYLAYFLNSPEGRRRSLAETKGSTRQTLNTKSIASAKIPVPSREDQLRIVAVLNHAEALRAKRRTVLGLLDMLAGSIFLDLFGDPVSNPRRWRDPKLGGVLLFQQYGPRFYNEAYSPTGIRIVRITDLDESGELDFESMPRQDVSPEDTEKYCLKGGDLIFARSGATVGKVALIRNGDPPCIAGAYFITMRFDDAVHPLYVRAVLAAPSVRAIIVTRSRQAAQQNFSGPGLRELPMPIPPLDLQKDYVKRIAAIENLRTVYRASLAQLDALFVSLQHRAFRGEL